MGLAYVAVSLGMRVLSSFLFSSFTSLSLSSFLSPSPLPFESESHVTQAGLELSV